MWYIIAAVLGGFILGFLARMIQQSVWEVLHTETAGTLRVVKFEDNPEDLLLQLNEPPSKLRDGQLISLDVAVTRRQHGA